MSSGFTQRYDGEYSDVTDGLNIACCDCGLIHRYEFVILNGRILKRVFRLNRNTAGYRNGMKRRKEGIFAKKKV